jgi:hypothetical protein
MIDLLQMLQSQTGGTGFCVFIYTSPQLAAELHKMKIHFTGTAITSCIQKNKTWKS